jgi:signal transduction histidine kinase
MKFLSQLFEARGTDWTSSAFKSARLKLVALYLLIIAVIIVSFAYLVVLQVQEKASSQRIPSNSQIVLNAAEARAKAMTLRPQKTIDSTEYVLEENTLHYVIGFADGEDVEVDLLTGDAQLDQDESGNESFFELFTDEVDETIWWIGIVVFLLASGGSIYVANMTLRPIAESVRKQKQFVSDASHELRNPLASLKTTLESYIRSSDKSKILSESIAEDLLEEVERLIVTSESLLELEKHEKQIKNIKQCILSQNLESVTQRLKVDLDEKNITVANDIAKTPLSVDSADLDTILYNLIHNAIKFSHENSEIKVTWNGKDLTVSDTGRGIEIKHIPHIFERFYKVDQARSFTTNSNGLGLALVHEILTSYGGTISVQSIVGKGTTFTVIF